MRLKLILKASPNWRGFFVEHKFTKAELVSRGTKNAFTFFGRGRT